MTSPALATLHDPFVLRAPRPDDTVVQPRWISATNTRANSRFSDDIWSLGPLIDQPGKIINRIHWKTNCPTELRGELQILAWTMINGERRPTSISDRGRSTHYGASSLHKRLTEWMRFSRWLHEHRVNQFADCTDALWRAYAAKLLADGTSRILMEKMLGWLSDLWGFDQLTVAPAGVCRPPWDTEGVDDYLPPEGQRGHRENATEPLDPSVVGPLLVWAIRLVEDFADDILAAWDERVHMITQARANKSTPEGGASLDAYLKALLATAAPLPVATYRGNTGLSRLYIAARTGASINQVVAASIRNDLPALAEARPGPCPLTLPVTGMIDGRPWRESMRMDEAEVMRRHLGTAAAVIILYLTGMRVQEVQGLRSGCCPDPEPAAEGTVRHIVHSTTDESQDDDGVRLISGRHYKTVTDDDGNHISEGEVRSVPWVAIRPVVHAIRVLERMVPAGELLLSTAHHDSTRRAHQGSLTAVGLSWRVADFVKWINQEAVAQGVPEQMVPEDPHGPIRMARWRRTLAWHIARRPGGLVALAVQYGHMRAFLDARTSAGYGARGRGGMHGVLDMETVLATADAAAGLRDAAAAGEKISGPAARQALTDAADEPHFAGALTTQNATKRLQSMEGHLLFDNPDGFLLCRFKHANALCDPDAGAIAPLPFACQMGCGNAVRTDAHAQAARAHADDLEGHAGHVPGPMADAFRASAAKWRGVADTHDATARSAQEILT